MTQLTLAQAIMIIAGAFQTGKEMALKPLSVSVLDAGGHVVALQRSDGASILRPEIATAKAAGALALGVSSREIGEMAVERPIFISTLSQLGDKGLVPAAGGVIIVDNRGTTIGAVGVTGDTSDNDEACALRGISAAGLRAQS